MDFASNLLGAANPLAEMKELKETLEKFIEMLMGNINKIINTYLMFLALDIGVVFFHKHSSSTLGQVFDMSEDFNMLQTGFIVNSLFMTLLLVFIKTKLDVERVVDMLNLVKILIVIQMILFGVGCSACIALATYKYQIANPILFQLTVSAKTFQFSVYTAVIVYIKTRPEFQALMATAAEAQLKIKDLEEKLKI